MTVSDSGKLQGVERLDCDTNLMWDASRAILKKNRILLYGALSEQFV